MGSRLYAARAQISDQRDRDAPGSGDYGAVADRGTEQESTQRLEDMASGPVD